MATAGTEKFAAGPFLEEAALPGEQDYLRREVYGGQQVELRCNKLAARTSSAARVSAARGVGSNLTGQLRLLANAAEAA